LVLSADTRAEPFVRNLYRFHRAKKELVLKMRKLQGLVRNPKDAVPNLECFVFLVPNLKGFAFLVPTLLFALRNLKRFLTKGSARVPAGRTK
jgi:hypothetical protein